MTTIAILDDGAAKPAVHRKARRVAAVPLPPTRPAESADPQVATIAEGAVAPEAPPASAAGFELDTTPRVGIAVLPPLRPAFQPEAASPAEPQVASVPLPPEAPPRLFPEDAPAFAVAILPPARPGFTVEPDPVETGTLPDRPAGSLFGSLFGPADTAIPSAIVARTPGGPLDERIAAHARLNGVPEALVHRVIVRESKYNPRAVGRGGALGLMQIKHATARGLGYGGTAAGLLDAETNLTWAVKYLAGAYRVANGDFDRAVRNYARGYYYEAKRQGFVRLAALGRRNQPFGQDEAASPARAPASQTAALSLEGAR